MLKIQVFLDVMPCGLVKGYWCSSMIQCYHL